MVLLALLTRGLHLDGLADTFDGLGSYAPPERALAILKSPEAGPLGVSAIVAALLVDAAALSALVARHDWLPIAAAVGIGRFGDPAVLRPSGAGRPAGRAGRAGGRHRPGSRSARLWALALAALAGLAGRLSPGGGAADWVRRRAGGAAGRCRRGGCWPGSACAASAG